MINEPDRSSFEDPAANSSITVEEMDDQHYASRSSYPVDARSRPLRDDDEHISTSTIPSTRNPVSLNYTFVHTPFKPLSRDPITMTFKDVSFRAPILQQTNKKKKSKRRVPSAPAAPGVVPSSLPSPGTPDPYANRPNLQTGENIHWKTVLRDISGAFAPGQLIAIMGSSGAGKTSLLNIFAGRILGYEGTVLFNGKKLHESKMTRRSVAYVQQDDVHFATLTPREHLTVHARLRMDRAFSDAEKLKRVDEVIRDLSLQKCQNTIMGSTALGRKGISGGEARRVTLATELLTDPSLIFIDEPTSGLDAFMAETIVRTLVDLARAGRTVVCTIHQPSSEVYAMFDQVMYLAEGRIAYFGKREEAPAYFGRCGYPIPDMFNPAEYIIRRLSILPNEVTRSRERISNVLESYAVSEERSANIRVAQELEDSHSQSRRRNNHKHHHHHQNDRHPSSGVARSPAHSPTSSVVSDSVASAAASATHDTDNDHDNDADNGNKSDDNHTDKDGAIVYSAMQATWWEQVSILYKRSFVTMWRDPIFTNIRCISTVFMSVLIGLIFLSVKHDQTSVQNRTGALYIVLVMTSFSGINEMLQVFPSELNIFRREHQSSMYSVSAYYVSRSVSELPFQVFFPIVSSAITYFMIGFHNNFTRFVIFNCILFLTSNCAASTGMLISSGVESTATALAVGPAIMVPLMLMSGYIVNAGTIPAWLSWIKYVSFFKYGFEALIENEWRGMTIDCSAEDIARNNCHYHSGEQVIKSLRPDVETVQGCVGILIGLIVVLRVLSYIFLLRRAKAAVPRAAQVTKHGVLLTKKYSLKSMMSRKKDPSS